MHRKKYIKSYDFSGLSNLFPLQETIKYPYWLAYPAFCKYADLFCKEGFIMSDELKNTMADEEQAPEQANEGAEISEQELDQASGGKRPSRAA